MDGVKAELAAATASGAEAKREAAALQSQLEAAKGDLEAARKSAEDQNGQIAALTGKLDKVAQERAELEQTSTLRLSELTNIKSSLHEEIKTKQGELDQALSNLDVLKGKMEVSEAAHQREKAELERKLGSLSEGRQALAGRLGNVSVQAKVRCC